MLMPIFLLFKNFVMIKMLMIYPMHSEAEAKTEKR